ncbi:MAG: hypothetical protein KIS96_14455 [Bauldia sp.]|nr:hypothetical protein [Bauldia sp.]
MSLEAPKFYRESWKDGYIHALQTKGHLLDGTSRRGDVKAKKVKWSIINEGNNVIKLSGALKPVVMASQGRGVIELDLDDYETEPDWIFTPDLEKIGPNEKQASEESLAMSVGRKKDWIQLDALAAYTADAASDHGAANLRVNPFVFATAKAKIFAKGGLAPGKVYCGIRSIDMEQLKVYPTFGKATWRGPEDLPLKRIAEDAITYNGVHYIVFPDSYFARYTPDAGDSFYYYMWHADCIGVESNWGDINTFVQVPTMEGNPWMLKIGFGAAAVGLLRDGVQRIRLDAISTVDEHVVKTKEQA